jgi:hypothetical protein
MHTTHRLSNNITQRKQTKERETYHPCHVSQADEPEENHPVKDENDMAAEDESELEEEAALEEASSPPPPLLPSSKEESSSPTRSTILSRTE